MVSEKLSNLEVMTKANVYWDGKVTSRTFFTADGEKHTLGIITAGTYTFGVGDREIVTLTRVKWRSSALWDADWVKFAAPQEFEIQGQLRV